jgi:hypothetical protein
VRGDGIKPLPAERMAPRDAAESQPRSAYGTVALDRLDRISRACRHEPTTGRRPPRDRPLVQSDHADQQSSEHNPSTASLTSPASLSKSAAYATLRALIKTSPRTPISSRPGRTCRRPISRRRRFSLFLSTTRCPCFGTMRPRREREAGEAAKKTSRFGVLFRFPRSSKSRISEPSRMRASLGSRSPPADESSATCRPPSRRCELGPACAGGSASCVRPPSSCAPETRACSSACGCAACMSASFEPARFMVLKRRKTSFER